MSKPQRLAPSARHSSPGDGLVVEAKLLILPNNVDGLAVLGVLERMSSARDGDKQQRKQRP